MSIIINKNNDISVAIVKNGRPDSHVLSIAQELENLKINYAITDFNTISNSLQKNYKYNTWAPVTIWRSSSLHTRLERPSLKSYAESTYMISESVFKHPFIMEKYYQQQIISMSKPLSKYHIPTYRFDNREIFCEGIEKRIIEFPIIAKPKSGKRGDGICMLKSVKDLDASRIDFPNYVFQKFIKNKGDWRVLVLGGRSLGAMHRLGVGEFNLNNISKGASGYIVEDPELLSSLYCIAEKVASLFDLRFCGVDIIRDEESGLFKILEVNTAPQWLGRSGFQDVTGINVAKELALYAQKVLHFINWRSNKELFNNNQNKNNSGLGSDADLTEIIDNYFQEFIGSYQSKSFHYYSRKWLWTGSSKARKSLDEMQDYFVGTENDDWIKSIARIMEDLPEKDEDDTPQKPYRASSLLKYPNLKKYNKILFKVMMAESIYGIDLRPIVKSYIDDALLIKMFHELIIDKDAIRLLSTLAINFIYLLKNYFKNNIKKSVSIPIDPLDLLDIAKSYEDLITNGVIDRRNSVRSKIYLLTHAIIGESRFYQREVRNSTYELMCREINDLIKNNYFQATLDNKCEFLVCCKLVGYHSDLENMIKEECLNSISKQGIFIIDNEASATSHRLSMSEHRNILYIMSQTKMNLLSHRNLKKAKEKIDGTKLMLGRSAKVKIPSLGPWTLVARVDTGAANSSICATDIREKSGNLYFKLLDPDSPIYTGKIIKTNTYRIVKVRTAQGKDSYRYEITTKVNCMGEDIETDFNLIDRSHMIYPLILGRKFLKGRFIVDPDVKFFDNYLGDQNKEVNI